ncbi:hypothetical protein A2814_02555 [Candidatus Nomurabacteria bacterium RIFCSPHIGHO2_01_FULL_38_19]|uniref:Methyltransferase type 11 domain-containing protein n=1 Tax=Candidatus Nomurabacteria bacterium RIFCSPHIGHO2_01_FULL_38_19 TaxID=1801732 RepID=A0A1F6URD1_9BACT|nr:MAG: hypothetical protein A2814_02555 [Candidatus Nomurabacteria bacterium RIFCSPHIGHO2_01_FULL_38_19]
MEDRFETIHTETFDKKNRKKYAENSIHSNAPFEDYKYNLGIDIKDLKNKKVLDIGGKPNGIFAHQALRKGIDLITFNPAMSALEPSPSQTVAGYVQEIPFKNETFDLEIALGSVPIYLPNYESEYRNMFSEIIRTLKTGGKGIIYPIPGNIYQSKIFLNIIKDLE